MIDYAKESVKAHQKELSRHPILTTEEEVDLCRGWKKKSARQKRTVRDRLIESNLRYAVKVAGEYGGRGVAYEDLVCEANVGLVEAAKRFDPDRGYKFITYAIWWIRRSLIKAVRDQYVVSYPNNVAQNIYEVFQNDGQHPDGMTPRAYQSALAMSNLRIVRLDNCMAEDESSTYGEALPDPNAADPSDVGADAVLEAVAQLPERLGHIIARYYGLDGRVREKLGEIGKDLGITRERVRQLRNKGMAILLRRHGRVLRELM